MNRVATPAALAEGERFVPSRALANLLDNALDLAPAGSTVQAALSVLQRRSTGTGTIADARPGLPGCAIDKVFDWFCCPPRPRNGKQSSGLGLGLVREITTLHHGQTMLENRLAIQWPGRAGCAGVAVRAGTRAIYKAPISSSAARTSRFPASLSAACGSIGSPTG